MASKDEIRLRQEGLLIRLKDLRPHFHRVSSFCEEDQDRPESRRAIPEDVVTTVARIGLDLRSAISQMDRLVHPEARPTDEKSRVNLYQEAQEKSKKQRRQKRSKKAPKKAKEGRRGRT